MDLSPGGSGRLLVVLAVLGVLGLSAWLTMDDTKFRTLTLVLLGFFAMRTVLSWRRSR